MRIGLLSDTHSYLDPQVFELFAEVDEIWHAGDVGKLSVAEELKVFKPFRCVYGNIDGQDIRLDYPRDLRWECEGMDVWMTHIGGYPGRYNQRVRSIMKSNPPGLFICGHSHILKVMFDEKHQCLHINPGAAGKSGFHRVRTMVRFSIVEGRVKDLEAIELGHR
ncbi:MAG: metallophosphatase family protein [Bacteroidia bacterium]|nr:metallophosphatase family protein [Bacteroidia bacterium]